MREIMRGRKKAGDEKPPAELEDRPGDLPVPPLLLLESGLFRTLSKQPNPEKLPGILRLRTFKAGEAVCREGDPGWTAFFILSADDVSAMSPAGLEAEIARRKAAPKPDAKKIAKLEELLDAIPAAIAEARSISRARGEAMERFFSGKGGHPKADEECATVYGRPRRDDAPPPPGFLGRLFGWGKADAPEATLPGMAEYGQKKARLRPGQVFGDWSCIYGTPRAATIIADRDLLVVEMLRNALDVILSDDKYQKKAHEEYIARTLERHLAELPVFRSLKTEELERIRQEAVSDKTPPERKIEFLQYRSDQIVFDKGASPDGLYIVQRGLVKVLASTWPLLTADDILDEAKARGYLATKAGEPHKRFLLAKLRPLVAAASLKDTANALLKDKGLTGAAGTGEGRKLREELKGLLGDASFLSAWEAGSKKDPKEWDDAQWLRFNRLALSFALPGIFRTAAPLLEKEADLDEAKLRMRAEDPSASPARVFFARRLWPGGAGAAVNALLRDGKLTAASGLGEGRTLRPELAGLLEDASFKAAWENLSAKDPKEWDDAVWQRFNRLVFSFAFPGIIKTSSPLLEKEADLDALRLRALLDEEASSRPRVFLAERVKPSGPGAAALRDAVNAVLADKSLTGAVAKAGNPPKRELRPELAPLLEDRSFMAAWETRLRAMSADWADSDWRAFNRLVLEAAWPGALRQSRQGAEHVLNYVPKGSLFGEVGIMMDRPRAATCVAYVHPRPRSDDEAAEDVEAWRGEQRVELVRLPRPLVEQLCRDYPSIDALLRGSAAGYARSDAGRKDAAERAVRHSPEFQRQGLIQGRKLMLIDLDRCTRCDECVRACVDTHQDGRTRLFLDGERFGKYLVPTTCRLCRDPVCLIGCPVGSIVQGKNHEIVIKDWCIGCQTCAKSCPYGSIQMHDRGLVPEQSADWRFLPASKLRDDSWTRPGYRDGRWPQGMAPFAWDEIEASARIAGAAGDAPTMAFRLPFDLSPRVFADKENGLKLTVATDAAERKVEGTGKSAKVVGFIGVWINGKEVPAGQWRKHSEPGRELNTFVFEVEAKDRTEWFRPGRNVIAVQATPAGGTLLGLALDESKPTGVIAEKAVVCDQCGTMDRPMPACVHACPHDAAMRVDAWSDEFPVR
ncbi:MAG: 4Fe-4S binding protein [Gemmataceae bacterium]|nr:4Fe-4S binding protein [Gemmataceae bacterium]